MESHVLDAVVATERKAVHRKESPVPVSCVEVDTEALQRMFRARQPMLAGTAAGATVVRGRRTIPPATGHALEKLGHAIEYVTDEYIHEGCEGGFSGSRIAAIQLLMSLNRDVYYACPLVSPLSQRIRAYVSRAIGASSQG